MQSGNFENHPIELEKCRAFVRGDMGITAFEDWLYFEKLAESALGPELFLEAVSTDFGQPHRVADLRHRLSEILPAPAACRCHTIPNRHLVTMGASSPDTFDHLEGGTGDLHWMHRVQCRVCATEWWVVEESRIYDVWILFRGWANRPIVDTYRELLSLAQGMGARVHYVHPEVSIEIPAAIKDLAKESPGIAVSELARLLPIPLDVVWLHARRVSQEADLNIDLEN